MTWILISYLIGAVGTFIYFALSEDSPYEFTIFVSVFYPIIMAILLLLLLLTPFACLIFGIGDRIRNGKNEMEVEDDYDE